MQSIVRTLYGAYAGFLFAFTALLTGLLILTLPRVRYRRRIGAFGMRLFCRLARMGLRVENRDLLPEGPAVVVANHMSYLDGLVFTAALPERFGFVIKREASRMPLVGSVLRRMGAEFVDRHDVRRGSSDTRRLLRSLQAGKSLGFFPEGSLKREPGLRPFRLGAFLIAARAGVPVVPAAVDGTREILPCGRWLPNPGKISVRLRPPLTPDGQGRDAAQSLRDRAWAEVHKAVNPEETDSIHMRKDHAA